VFRFRIVRRRVRRKKSVRKVSPRYLKHKEATRALVTERIAYFNQFYGCAVGRIAIRNQKSRWGSCSRKGNLNFNYRLSLIPPHLADYVIVHELCHLKQFDHSQAFWDLVAEQYPEHVAARAELRKFSLS
jgi:hypothetical protein